MTNHNPLKNKNDFQNVAFTNRQSVYIEDNVIIGAGTHIEPNVIIKGNTIIGKNSNIFVGAYIDNSKIGDNCIIGQYTILRSGVSLKNNVKIGPHSEIARSSFGENSGAYHRAIVLDTIVEENVMIGAGVVTANTKHDGKSRKITIKNGAKIGINVSLVAPLTIHENSWIGAGSTITKDVHAGTIVIARSEQKTIKDGK